MDMNNWAVIGATDKKDKFGYKIVKTLKDNGYKVFPVNPNYDKVAGLTCYSDISQVADEVDVVDFVINPSIGRKAIEDVAENGLKYVWLQPGARSKEIKEYAEDHNISVVESCIYAQLKKN